MKYDTFPYKGLHDYLDTVFASKNHVTEEEIIAEKKAYWKLYYRHYRKYRRTHVKREFTLGFDKQALKLMHQKRKDLSISEFLYACIYTILTGEKYHLLDTKPIDKLHQQLMELISLIEELLEDYDIEMNQEILSRLENIEQQFLKL